MNRRLLFSALLLACAVAPAVAQPNMASPESTFAYEQHLNFPVPLDLQFRDEDGKTVALSEFFGKRPLVLVLAQYRCPMLCTQVLNGVVDALRGLPGDAGEQFDVVVVSFDPRETPELAAAKKQSYVEDYRRPGAAAGWHFLTGEQASIGPLADAVGFRYAYVEKQDRFAHPSGIVVLTPGGRVSRYFYGIKYNSGDLEQAIANAAAEKIGAPVPSYARVLLLCYDFDPATGNYVFNVLNAVRLGGVVTVIAIAAFLVAGWLRERRKARPAAVAKGADA
jgi:protein SCO1/2